jgi:hypothetical protein
MNEAVLFISPFCYIILIRLLIKVEERFRLFVYRSITETASHDVQTELELSLTNNCTLWVGSNVLYEAEFKFVTEVVKKRSII